MDDNKKILIRIRVSESLYDKISDCDLENSDCIRKMYRKIHKGNIKVTGVNKKDIKLNKMICTTIDKKYSYISIAKIREGLELVFSNPPPTRTPLCLEEIKSGYKIVDN